MIEALTDFSFNTEKLARRQLGRAQKDKKMLTHSNNYSRDLGPNISAMFHSITSSNAFQLVMIVMIDRKQKMWRKVVLYFGNYRNGVLLFATVTYVIAFCIRCNPSSR